MNLNELKSFLGRLGVRPKKGLSQNFLIDQNITDKIVREADVRSSDLILEIGPGPGALTEKLIEAGAEVVAVELDTVYARELKRFAVTVHEMSILDFDFAKLPRQGKVVSNLPYHLTAPILTRLMPHRELFSTVTVMVQEEVARRLTAKPNTSAYGSLTVFLNFYAEARYAFLVPPQCFYPEPNVDSAVVTFTLKEPPQVEEEPFFAMVRAAFAYRRKMLKKNLKPMYGDKVESAMEACGINLKARAQELSLETFIALFEAL